MTTCTIHGRKKEDRMKTVTYAASDHSSMSFEHLKFMMGMKKKKVLNFKSLKN